MDTVLRLGWGEGGTSLCLCPAGAMICLAGLHTAYSAWGLTHTGRAVRVDGTVWCGVVCQALVEYKLLEREKTVLLAMQGMLQTINALPACEWFCVGPGQICS
jgi:hypothetical protein